MINPKKLLRELNLREDDSKRIDAILESLKNQDTQAIKFKDFMLTFNLEYNRFQAGSAEPDTEHFKDGREAIDYCLSSSSPESLPDSEDVIPTETEEKEN